MKLLIALILTASSLCAVCQEEHKPSTEIQRPATNASQDQFVGTWRAQFKGKTFLTIKLEKQQTRLAGTTSHADVKLDKAGELVGAEELDGSDPIIDAKLTNGVLLITSKDEDSQDTIQCEMKLTGTDQAELRMLVPPDVSKPNWWKLARAKDTQ